MPILELNYRTATLDDIPTLLELEQSLLEAERPFNTSIKDKGAYYYDLEHMLNDENTFLIVAELNHKLVGTGYVQLRQSKAALSHAVHGYLGFMYVSSEQRGKGINKVIMQQLIEWAKSKGVKDFYLDVYAVNESAIRAYQKLGFTSNLLEMKLTL